MSEMRIIDGSGDTKLIWNRCNADEVSNAERTFGDLIKKKFTAFEVKVDGKKGTKITKFNPDAEKIIMVPMVAGG